MLKKISMHVVAACGLLSATAAVCAGQTYTPPPPPLTTLPPCPLDKNGKPLKKQKNCDPTVYPTETKDIKGRKAADAPVPNTAPDPNSAAQKFPFPGEQPAKTAEPPVAQKFPYPGEAAGQPAANSPTLPASKQFPYPGQATPGSDIPHDPAAEKRAADTPAGKRFPFPGESTPDLQPDPSFNQGAAPTRKPDTASSDSSPAGSSSSSSDDADAAGSGKASDPLGPKNQYDDDDTDKPKLTDKGSEGKRSKKVIKPQTDTERVDDDLSVARYYGQSGNFMGAYLRAKDAVKTQPEYPEAHFVLGEAARRLNKKDEAVAEFTQYLKLAPDGEKAKAAEKDLTEIK